MAKFVWNAERRQFETKRETDDRWAKAAEWHLEQGDDAGARYAFLRHWRQALAKHGVELGNF